MGESHEHYYDDVDIYDYDKTITSHPLMDQLKAGVVAAVLAARGIQRTHIIEVGAGSGQMTRVLLGFPYFSVLALDKDPHAAKFFADHPELNEVEFISSDVFDFQPDRKMDVVVCVGFFHHMPKARRPSFIKKLLSIAPVVVIGDEFLAGYSNAVERTFNCARWYEWVISESSRRGLEILVRLETAFMEHDLLADGADEGDFKESLELLRDDVGRAGARIVSTVEFGDRDRLGGGMAVVTVVPSKKGVGPWDQHAITPGYV
jgi:predicted RNA methylase